MNEKELLKLKERIDKAKSKVSELKGKRDYLLQELKRQWDCDNIKQAQEVVHTLEEDITALNQQITDRLIKLEEQIDA